MGLNEFELLVQILSTIRRFVGQRRAVARWAAFYNVANVDLLALHAASRNDSIEQFARRPNEWFSGGIFVGARRFTDKTEVWIEFADPAVSIRKRLVNWNPT